MVKDVLAEWSEWMKASACAQGTIELRNWHLRQVLAHLELADPWRVTTAQLVKFLGTRRSPNTKRSYRASLRAFYGWAVDMGHLEVSPAHKLPRVRVPRALPRPIADPDYRAALATTTDRRVRIAVQLGGQCGLRRGEIARVRTEDVDQRGDGNHWLYVVGKGGHERWVPLPNDLVIDILLCPPGWVFPSPRRPGQPLTAPVIGKYIASQLPGAWTTHSLRHRAGTESLAGSGDIRATQELLGHANLNTTMLYTFVDDARVRAAMESAA